MFSTNHVHLSPGEEAQAPGWTYTVLNEEIFLINEKNILVILGEAVIGSACVGAVDIRVLIIPGYIITFHHSIDRIGRAVSIVKPIENATEIELIRKELKIKYPSLQVLFK